MRYLTDNTSLKVGDYCMVYGKKSNCNCATVFIGRVSVGLKIEADGVVPEDGTFEADLEDCWMCIVSDKGKYESTQEESISLIFKDDIYLLDDDEILRYVLINTI